QSQFLGRPVAPHDLKSQVEFWAQAGYDYIPLNIGMMEPGKVTENSHISKVLQKILSEKDDLPSDEGQGWNVEVTSFIHNWRDFEAFPWDELGALNLSQLKEVGPLLPQGMKAIGVSGKIFTLTWMLMGFNNFALSLIREPKLVAAVFEKVAAIQYSALSEVLKLPHVGAVWVVDDLAYNSGPIISLKHLNQYVFPWYKEMARRCHEAGLLFILHSDGKLDALLPAFIDMGLDIIQPIDPTCNDIVAIKKMVAGKLTIVGNVPNEMLQVASPQEIQDYVRMLLKKVAPGGGFMLGSGNSVPNWAQFENYQAMRLTALNEGVY
ncbi:MAG: uroporphyrinogen decarboxylase family protein, partial [Candidatus Adiutrix sp.]